MFKIIFLLFSISTFAANSGQVINANDFNNSSYGLGDIKTSILNQSQFQSEHGDCWTLMDGKSIIGKDLATLTGTNTVPDGRGQFLRALNSSRNDGNQNPDGITLGSYQADAARVTFPTSYANYGGAINATYLSNSSYLNPGSTNWQVYGTQSHGDAETRPRSITLNFFIKIHNTCN